MLHCVPNSRRPNPLHALAYTFTCASRTVSAKLNACLDYISDTIPDGAPLIIAGDFNDWREQAHRRLLRDAALEDLRQRFRTPSANISGAFSFIAARPDLRSQSAPSAAAAAARPWAMLSDHPLAGQVRVNGGCILTADVLERADLPPLCLNSAPTGLCSRRAAAAHSATLRKPPG
jgi:hypothetical protein